MDKQAIEAVINDALALDELHVTVDGSHVAIIAVGAVFENVNRVKKQQLVYNPLKPSIESGEIHAVSIKSYTPAEWEKDKKLVLPS